MRLGATGPYTVYLNTFQFEEIGEKKHKLSSEPTHNDVTTMSQRCHNDVTTMLLDEAD